MALFRTKVVQQFGTMPKVKKSPLFDELRAVLKDDAALLRLIEAHAGCRLFIAVHGRMSQLVAEIGDQAAERLSRAYGGVALRIPMAREWRAEVYRKGGKSTAQIARLIGITETGVDKLFKRVRDKEAAA